MLTLRAQLIREDVAEELSWRHALVSRVQKRRPRNADVFRLQNDYLMPYRLQRMRDRDTRFKALEKEVRERSKKDSEKEQAEDNAPILGPGMGGQLMIGGPQATG